MRPVEPPARQSIDSLLTGYAEETTEAYERGGQAPLAAYLDRAGRIAHPRILIQRTQGCRDGAAT